MHKYSAFAVFFPCCHQTLNLSFQFFLPLSLRNKAQLTQHSFILSEMSNRYDVNRKISPTSNVNSFFFTDFFCSTVNLILSFTS